SGCAQTSEAPLVIGAGVAAPELPVRLGETVPGEGSPLGHDLGLAHPLEEGIQALQPSKVALPGQVIPAPAGLLPALISHEYSFRARTALIRSWCATPLARRS